MHGDPYYIINTPLFNEVTLNLENGNKFKIQCNGLEDASDIYIKSGAFHISDAYSKGKKLEQNKILSLVLNELKATFRP